jgi:type IV pilus assembly protein PilA
MFNIINKLKNRKGFTLIELIVVLAVLAIITAIAVPRFAGVQEQARIDADYSSGSLIGKAAEIYAVEGYDSSDIKTKLADDFPQGITFQSSKIEGQDLDAVTLEVDADTYVVTVKVTGTDDSTSYEIYPTQTSLD